MTTLIKNAQVIDGTGRQSEKLDVVVSGQKISALGSFSKKTADHVIDAQGGYLMPGFIDIHTSADHYLTIFEKTQEEALVQQGITTTIAGYDGVSLAPFFSGSLELFRRWTRARGVNADWHTFREFIAAFRERTLGFNMATFVGYETVLHACTGTAAAKEKHAKALRMIDNALHYGAVGISVSLMNEEGKDLPYAALKSLAHHAKHARKPLAVSLSEENALQRGQLETLIKLARETEAKLIIHNLSFAFEDGEEEFVGTLIEQAKEHGILFDLNPHEQKLTHIEHFLPAWARQGGRQAMRVKLADAWFHARIAKETMIPEQGECVLAHAPGAAALAGHSLSRLRDHYGLEDERQTLLAVLASAGERTALMHQKENAHILSSLLASRVSLIGSHAPYTVNSMERRDRPAPAAVSTFPRYLEMISKGSERPLEWAVRKVTSTAAKVFGIPHRGEIKEGNFADLVVMKDGQVQLTIVNGTEAYVKGRHGVRAAGRVLAL